MDNNKTIYRAISLMVSFVLFCLSVMGCVIKQNRDSLPRIIEETTPWYHCEKRVYSESRAGTCETSVPVFADRYCRVFYKLFDETSSSSRNELIFIDNEDKITDISLSAFFEDSEQFSLDACVRANDAVYAMISRTENGVRFNGIYRIDTGKTTLEHVDDLKGVPEESYYVDRMICSNDCYYSHIYYIENNTYKDAFCIFDKDYNLLQEMHIDNYVVYWSLNSKNQIVTVEYNQSNIANPYMYSAILDLDKGVEKKTSTDSDLLAKYRLGYTSDNGFCYLTNKDLTLTKLDLETGEETLVLDFNNSSINLFDLQCSSLFYCEDDYCILRKDAVYPSESTYWMINTLTKEEINPNSGKQIIYSATSFQIGSMVASAIEQMNSSDKGIYIFVTMDYSRLTFIDYEKSDDETTNSYNKNIALISKLKNDISIGEGPDILLDFAQYSGLNEDEYLCDLQGIINDKASFNREDYFDNIFDAYVKDGKLYQIPVSACIGGIYAPETVVSDSKPGFTYSEYEEFVATQCDGFDPLEYELGRNRCFSLMVRSRYNDLFDSENHLVANNGVFGNTCGFVRDMMETPDLEAANAEYFVEFNRIHFDLTRRILNENNQLYGLPSEDGSNGPIVFAYESIGISSKTSQFEKAFEFVKCLLSYEVQIQNAVYNPINREAFSYYAEDAIAYAEVRIQKIYGQSAELDPSIIYEYIDYICSANTSYMCDDYALLIMNEELQPYYQHQKEFADVIPIIENRIKNMTDELNG